jgi:hypothetical protein
MTNRWTMVLLLICSCAHEVPHPGDKANAPNLQAVATNVFGIELVPTPVTGVDGNLVTLHTGTFTVEQRSDSRTYFVRNRAFGALSDDGVFDGSEDDLRRTAARIMAGLNIDLHELAAERVLQVFQGAGEFDDATGASKTSLWESKHRVLVAGRQVDGVPVFSSRLSLALTASGAIGRLKVHWPEIPTPVLDEAKRYQGLLRGGFKPPAAKDAVASVTAGILHSSPHSRRLDMMAAFRVEYVKGPLGRARVIYLSANGQTVRARHDDHAAPPRQHKPSR